MQSEKGTSVNFNGQLNGEWSKAAKWSVFITLRCILSEKIVWDQIEKAPKHKGCKVSITLIILEVHEEVVVDANTIYVCWKVFWPFEFIKLSCIDLWVCLCVNNGLNCIYRF